MNPNKRPERGGGVNRRPLLKKEYLPYCSNFSQKTAFVGCGFEFIKRGFYHLLGLRLCVGGGYGFLKCLRDISIVVRSKLLVDGYKVWFGQGWEPVEYGVHD